EIDAEVQVMAAEKESAFTTQLENDSRYVKVPAQRERIQALQTPLAQAGTDADVLGDPAVVDLQGRLDDANARYNAAAEAFLCETDGSCGTGDAGIAAAALEKKAERDRLEAERDGLQDQLNALKVQVREQLDAEEEQ